MSLFKVVFVLFILCLLANTNVLADIIYRSDPTSFAQKKLAVLFYQKKDTIISIDCLSYSAQSRKDCLEGISDKYISYLLEKTNKRIMQFSTNWFRQTLVNLSTLKLVDLDNSNYNRHLNLYKRNDFQNEFNNKEKTKEVIKNIMTMIASDKTHSITYDSDMNELSVTDDLLGRYVILSPALPTFKRTSKASSPLVALQTTEVTQLQWYMVMSVVKETELKSLYPSKRQGENFCPKSYLNINGGIKICPNHPVEYISQKQIKKFIKVINNQDPHFKYNLPNLENWKKVITFLKLEDVTKNAWVKNKNQMPKSMPVGQKKINSNGFYDIFGNVAEFTSDGYAVGGSYINEAHDINKVIVGIPDKVKLPLVGFRLVRRPKN